MTFVNKMDREARDPLELLDEISDQLQLECAPMVWPAGMGLNFKGVLDLYTDEFVKFGTNERIPADAMKAVLPDDVFAKLEEEAELAQAGLSHFLSKRTAITRDI